MCGIFFYFSKKETNHVKVYENFMKMKNRGPDNTQFVINDNVILGFHRLKINDLSDDGNQPMYDNESYLICNGEIYNNNELNHDYKLKLQSYSDCETILKLYNHLKISEDKKYHESYNDFVKIFVNKIHGEFAFIIFDKNINKMIAVRDRFGVRPLYFGSDDNSICLSSELKGIDKLFDNVEQFKPSHFMIYDLNKTEISLYNSYYNMIRKVLLYEENTEEIYHYIRTSLYNSVKKRLTSDRPYCALLSGGLDSSLICALIAKMSDKKLHTFSIGMQGSTDLYYADIVAKYINSEHHCVMFTNDDFLNAIEDTIKVIESYDITSVRASTGNYLIAKYIKENTDFKVVFTGEYADEVQCGYMYFKNAPNSKELQEESNRLVTDICYFDSLRCDRSIANNGLEARVPYSDVEFIETYQHINPELKMCNKNIEKYLIREAFSKEKLLPDEILWRKKEAFSDGVSSTDNSWHNIIKTFVDNVITDEEFNNAKYDFNQPKTKEAYYYRKIYDKYYNNYKTTPYFWLPKWSGNKDDPSARELKVYNNSDDK